MPNTQAETESAIRLQRAMSALLGEDQPYITPEEAMGWPETILWWVVGAFGAAVLAALVAFNWPLFVYAASEISTAH